VTAVLSFFFAGLGQIYNGQIGKGLGIMFAYFTVRRIWLVLIALLLIGTSASAQAEKTLRLATGPPDGTYKIIGEAIRQAAQKSLADLHIEVLTTGASFDNMGLLERGEADLALAQNDVAGELSRDPKRPDELLPWRTVLVLMQEPVQIVAGPPLRGDSLDALSGHPLALGRRGSGTYFTASEMFNVLKIEYSEVSVQSSSELADALRRQEAHAGFFISNTPHPQVAALLADPAFRLLTFNTREMDTLHDSSPYYVAATIPEHTYPNQSRSVATTAVLTVLLCRPSLPADTVERLATALLHDAASPTSSLRRLQSAASLAAILQLTGRAAVPLHPGAERALQTLPFALRAQAYINWLQWSALMALSWFTLAVAHLRRLRLSLICLIAPRLPASLAHSLRQLFFNRRLWRVLRTLSLLGLVWLAGSAAMYLAEREVNVNFANLGASSLSIIVYLFSGLEDRIPVTIEGWMVSVIMLISGLLVAAYITGQFASEIMQHTSGAISMINNIAKRNLLVIGWNPRAERVVRELFGAAEVGLGEHSVTVLSEQKVDTMRFAEFESRGVTFVSGDTFHKKVLERIGAHEARSIIVIADDEAEDPDAKTALNVLALRSLCREKSIPDDRRPRICAEVLNHRKMGLIRDAGADDVVCHQDYGLGVLAQSAFAAKITQVYHELLSYSVDTCEIYMLTSPRQESQGDIPADLWDVLFEGKSFAEAADVFNRHRDSENPAILVGVRRGESLFLNPRNRVALQRGDDLAVMAFTRPRLERLRAAIGKRTA
jgi:hypothetical protein